jgi:lysyl-tRNA synthetase, class II
MGMTDPGMNARSEFRVPDAPARPDWLPPVAGLLTAAAALLNIVSALTPNFAWRARILHQVEGKEFIPLAHALALSAGVALLVLAFYLAKRRRRALELTVTVLFAAGVLNLVKGLDWEEAIVSWSVAALLFLGRRAFYVRHHRSLPSASRFVPAAAAVAYLSAFAAVCAASGHVTPKFTVARGLEEVFWRLLLTPGSLTFHHPFGWIPTAIGILSIWTLLTIA